MTATQFSPSSTAYTPLRIGIIGSGWFGRVHVERMSAIPDVQIAAVSDPDEAARKRLVGLVPETAQVPQAGVADYADYRDLLKHEGLQAIVICSPNKWHVEQLLAGLDKGLHVLCEKPLTMVPSEVSQVVAATEKAQRLVAVAYQSRYRRDARILHHLLHAEKWGRVTTVSVFSNEGWLTPNVGTWRHDPARCPGGFFADANGHQLDFMFWATGLEAAWVRATTETRGTPVPMVTWGEARLVPQGSAATRQSAPGSAEGIPFTFTFVGDAHHWREEICITTERADLVMRNGRLHFAAKDIPFAPIPDSEIDPSVLDLPDLPDKGFVAALRGGPPIVSPPETVWPVLKFTLAALASAANGSAPRATADFSAPASY